jgi:8-amino-7-oxononanoate synthase
MSGEPTMPKEAWIVPLLEDWRARGLERRLNILPRAGGKFPAAGREVLNFASNDYLDLAHDPHVQGRASEAMARFGSGSAASRLMAGTLECHAELEAALASWQSFPAALVFGSGCLANLGTLAVLLGRDDVAFVDRLAHATILDGVALSRARLRRFQHNDPDHLGRLLAQAAATRRPRGRFLVATESVFSMDGDLAPLAALAEAADRYEAMLLVDEAHALGVFGPRGAGLVAAAGLGQRVNVQIGTLSKALASYGGFACCSATVRELLIQRSRQFIYTTALPPASAAAALAALEIVCRRPELGPTLLARAESFRRELQGAGLRVMPSAGQIVPLLVGDSAKAVRLSERLKAEGILAPAIREPTVPRGTARLRLSVTLAHGEDDLRRAAVAVANAVAAESG